MPNPTAGKKRKAKKSTDQQKPRKWVWGPEQETAFEKLKNCLSSPPILGFADYNRPFELHTDASGCGLGAVLYQRQDGIKRVLCYASRGLSKSERNYPAHKLEFLALKWAISEKFHDYLYGHEFTVFTDNNPLTYVLTSAKLDATGHRWLAALAAYNFDVQYRPGSSNADADALSRLPGRSAETTHISTDSVSAVCKSSQTVSYVEGLACSATVVDTTFPTVDPNLRKYSDDDIRAAQRADPVLGAWVDALEKGSELHHCPSCLLCLCERERCAWLHIFLLAFLSACLPVCPPVYMRVCLSASLPVYKISFFPPGKPVSITFVCSHRLSDV
jgi:hypothetical protein